MNSNSKIWAHTMTSTLHHAVRDGKALCRSSISFSRYAGQADDAKTRAEILQQFPGARFCTSCEAKMLTHESFVDSEHAIALVMNEKFDAKAAPACICPPSYAANDHHETPCPLYVDTDSKENDNVSIKEGPLTERQIRILNHLRAGKRHEEIAPMLAPVPGHSSIPQAVTVSVVKQECQNIRVKFGTSTVMQAVSLWATAQAYRETATLLGSHRPTHPDNETDVHVDHVLYGLMQILRERADRLTPR